MNTAALRRGLTAGLVIACAGVAVAEEESLADVLLGHVSDTRMIEIIPGLLKVPLPAGISLHLVMITLSAGLVLGAGMLVFHRPARRIRGLANAFEALVVFVRDDIVRPVMGPERAPVWLPFFATLFLFLVTVNLLGLIPAFGAATGNANVTTALALLVLALMFGVGIHRLGPVGFIRNMYMQGIPRPIAAFVFLLELSGFLVKSMVLSLRLFANMFAGHLAIASFLVLIFLLHPLSAFVAVPFALFTFALEVLVALIQAFVFTLLACIFIEAASSSHAETG